MDPEEGPMAFTHTTDTVFAIKADKGIFTLRVARGFLPRYIARKRLFPIADSRFSSYLSPRPVVVDQATGDYDVTFEMEPGEVSVFGEWEGDASFTNYRFGDDSYPPVNRLTVACLKEPAEPPIDFIDFHVVPRGTYAHFQGIPPTIPGPDRTYFARLWVDEDPTNISTKGRRIDKTLQQQPGTHPQFYAEFPRPPVSIDWSFLKPGTTYSYQVQLIDNFGNHNAIQIGSFTTKQRVVDVSVIQLKVTNDGDDQAKGEAEFVASIFKDGSVVGKVWHWGDDDSPVEITDGSDGYQTMQAIGLHESFPAEPGDYKVGVNAIGREFDLTSDELATLNEFDIWAPWPIPYKVGPDEVNDVNVKQWLKIPTTGMQRGLDRDTFEFEIEISYSVTYV
jgi:hypothetical protein